MFVYLLAAQGRQPAFPYLLRGTLPERLPPYDRFAVLAGPEAPYIVLTAALHHVLAVRALEAYVPVGRRHPCRAFDLGWGRFGSAAHRSVSVQQRVVRFVPAASPAHSRDAAWGRPPAGPGCRVRSPTRRNGSHPSAAWSPMALVSGLRVVILCVTPTAYLIHHHISRLRGVWPGVPGRVAPTAHQVGRSLTRDCR